MNPRPDLPDPLKPAPYPDQPPMRQHLVATARTRLWCADTGGQGETVVFLHPAASGDPRLWGYQIPALVEAGYRVICYARRGYFKSDAADPADPGCAADDLRDLIDALQLGQVHLVSSGGGGSIAADHVLSNPQQVLSLTVSSNYAGIRKGPIRDAAERARPPQWNALPRWFREFSTSYVVANPKGVEDWIALQEESTKHKGVQQTMANRIDGETLERIGRPVLLLTGDADSSTPPSLMRMVAGHIPQAELVIVPEAGHSPYWETPDVFNRALQGFLARNRVSADPSNRVSADR